jgi:molybdopterin-guanine dinucleotide biosynthesis protein B
LIAAGLRVSTIKHAHRGFDLDRPGKDSFRHREAGAHEVLLLGDRRFALLHEFGDAEPGLEALLARMEPVDLVLIEGFRDHPIPKLEVYRPGLGLAPLWPARPEIVAVATDAAGSPASRGPVWLDLNLPSQIASWIATSAAIVDWKP